MADKVEAPKAPYDVELEQAILGSLLVDNSLIETASGILDPEHFYDPFHQRLFELICHLVTEGDVNPVILKAVLNSDKDFWEVGGIGYLVGLAQAAPALPPIARFCQALRDIAARRQAFQLAGWVIAETQKSPYDAPTAALIENASDTLLGLLTGTVLARRRKSISAADAAAEMLRKIEQQAVTEKPFGVPTGLDPIDDILGGLFPGKFLVAAGRPGHGKSILGTNIGRNVAQAGVPVDYFSGEMGDDELAARVACEVDFDRCAPEKLNPLEYGHFTSMRATQGDILRAAEATVKFREWPLKFHHRPGMTLEWIEATCRRLVRERPGLRVVVIDHLHLVGWAGAPRGASRIDVVTEVTKRLKALAEELGIALLVLCQLNRALETRDDKQPQLSDLRDSGSIEQDADVVIGLSRPILYARRKIKEAKTAELRHEALMAYDDAKNVLEWALLKHRGGATTDDYTKLFIEEKASAIRGKAPTAGAQPGFDWSSLAKDLRG